jgi:hypothetical protein
MKKLFYAVIVGLGFIGTSCEHVENPFPPAVNVDLDTTIYPGNWSDYVANEWPDFTLLPNDDPDRNALIEDYTGHNCTYCPAAAVVAHGLHSSNPTRVFVASIHASPNGMSSFQALNLVQGYSIDFTNENGLDLGTYFGTTLANSGFFANPSGTVNRTNVAGEYFSGSGNWSTRVNNVLASPLKVSIKAKVNYFESPKKGFFLHTEIEKDASITNELGIVVCMMEDSLIGQQSVNGIPDPVTDYVHRDIFRGSIDGQTWGRTLTDDLMTNGKYYVNYSGIVPDQLAPQGQATTHNAENMHLLIYVYDKTTLEIYQVIKKKFIP